MKTFFTITAFLVAFSMSDFLNAQIVQERHSDPVKAIRVMADFDDPFTVRLTYDEKPKPGGKAHKKFLREQKLKTQVLHPVKSIYPVESRSVLEKPEVIASFSGNNVITSTPLDNHCAVNASEQVVSTINVHMLVTTKTGFWQGSYQLENFYAPVGITNGYFDPRVIYDPEQDRFIMALINGYVCHESQIVLAFSQTNDPRGAWNLYALDGCIDDDGTFADYPMLALTNDELFLTYNEVHSDSTWQAGFMGTQIHQINKMNGYNGEPLDRTVWRDISYNDRLIRNICPVRNADEHLPNSMYLVATRNFDIENDTIFLLHIDGKANDPETTLDITYRKMNNPYGVPPYAAQTRDSMDTNDGRILDAFLLENEIQFVSNSMDFNTGRSGFYHGFLSVDPGSMDGTGKVVGHPTDYLGYPGIAWTGNSPAEKDAIIVISHTSPTRHPGGSAIYSDGEGNYSDFVTIIEGQKPVDMLTGKIERWGDYAGIQRLYHEPGSVWVTCSYGRSAANVNEAWIAKLKRAEQSTATKEADVALTTNTFPNPSSEYVQMNVNGVAGANLSAKLFSQEGSLLHTIYNGELDYKGNVTLTFTLHSLPPGVYYVQLLMDGKEVRYEKVMKP